MKKVTSNSLNLLQKKHISDYTENLISHLFSSPVKNKTELLFRVAQYAKTNSLGELVLKQSLLKGTFSKATWQKQEVINQSDVSKSIIVTHPKEHADVRFLSEILTADAFINNDIGKLIKQISFNSEKPQKGALLISRGNMYKDATVVVNFGQEKTQSMVFDLDIKIGNNGTNDIFTGALCPYPLTKDGVQHVVLNDGLPLKEIQDLRVRHLRAIRYSINESHIDAFEKHLYTLENYLKQPITDPIILNNLIQQELLHYIALKILHKQPSLFATFEHVQKAQAFNERFFTKLEPYIKPTIFDNRDNFNRFIRDSLIVYNETVAEIAQNIEKSSWQGTGFEAIADDLFK